MPVTQNQSAAAAAAASVALLSARVLQVVTERRRQSAEAAAASAAWSQQSAMRLSPVDGLTASNSGSELHAAIDSSVEPNPSSSASRQQLAVWSSIPLGTSSATHPASLSSTAAGATTPAPLLSLPAVATTRVPAAAAAAAATPSFLFDAEAAEALREAIEAEIAEAEAEVAEAEAEVAEAAGEGEAAANSLITSSKPPAPHAGPDYNLRIARVPHWWPAATSARGTAAAAAAAADAETAALDVSKGSARQSTSATTGRDKKSAASQSSASAKPMARAVPTDNSSAASAPVLPPAVPRAVASLSSAAAEAIAAWGARVRCFQEALAAAWATMMLPDLNSIDDAVQSDDGDNGDTAARPRGSPVGQRLLFETTAPPAVALAFSIPSASGHAAKRGRSARDGALADNVDGREVGAVAAETMDQRLKRLRSTNGVVAGPSPANTPSRSSIAALMNGPRASSTRQHLNEAATQWDRVNYRFPFFVVQFVNAPPPVVGSGRASALVSGACGNVLLVARTAWLRFQATGTASVNDGSHEADGGHQWFPSSALAAAVSEATLTHSSSASGSPPGVIALLARSTRQLRVRLRAAGVQFTTPADPALGQADALKAAALDGTLDPAVEQQQKQVEQQQSSFQSQQRDSVTRGTEFSAGSLLLICGEESVAALLQALSDAVSPSVPVHIGRSKTLLEHKQQHASAAPVAPRVASGGRATAVPLRAFTLPFAGSDPALRALAGAGAAAAITDVPHLLAPAPFLHCTHSPARFSVTAVTAIDVGGATSTVVRRHELCVTGTLLPGAVTAMARIAAIGQRLVARRCNATVGDAAAAVSAAGGGRSSSARAMLSPFRREGKWGIGVPRVSRLPDSPTPSPARLRLPPRIVRSAAVTLLSDEARRPTADGSPRRHALTACNVGQAKAKDGTMSLVGRLNRTGAAATHALLDITTASHAATLAFAMAPVCDALVSACTVVGADGASVATRTRRGCDDEQQQQHVTASLMGPTSFSVVENASHALRYAY